MMMKIAAPREPRTVVMSGASGLLGGAIVELLQATAQPGDRVVRLVRREPKGEDELRWDPDAGSIDRAALATLKPHAFVHLSGENVGDGRWTDARKRVLVESRTKSTRLLAETIAALNPKPACFVSASAIGIYGTDQNDPITESAPSGDGFLAKLCVDWEASTEPARAAGIRTVLMRIGVVLSTRGGALTKMLPVFKLGGGGPIGGGKQIMSFISLGDAARGFVLALDDASLSGPVNLVAPEPVDNKTFTRTLGHVLHRPAIVPVPAFAISVAFGQMGKETVLASQNVVPKKLLDAGFAFEHPTLESTLRAELAS